MNIVFISQKLNHSTFSHEFEIIVFDNNFIFYKFYLTGLSISLLMDDPLSYFTKKINKLDKSCMDIIDVNLSNFNDIIDTVEIPKIGLINLIIFSDMIKSNVKRARRKLILDLLNSKKEEKNYIRSFVRGEISLDEINKKGIKFIKPI